MNAQFNSCYYGIFVSVSELIFLSLLHSLFCIVLLVSFVIKVYLQYPLLVFVLIIFSSLIVPLLHNFVLSFIFHYLFPFSSLNSFS